MLDLLEGANVGDAFLRNTQWLKWMIINVGDPLYTPFKASLPPFNSAFNPYSLSLNPRDVVGGGTQVAGVVTLPSPASSTVTATLSSSNCPALPLPASVTISSGQKSGTFVVTTPSVAQEADCVVTASMNSTSVSNTVSLFQLLSSLGFNASSVSGGNSMPAAVFLNASAPLGSITVQLSSDQPSVAAVPSSVVVPAGLSEGAFNVTTATVSSNTTVNITASYGGASTTSQLTVTAP
jgi:hypothetical protein